MPTPRGGEQGEGSEIVGVFREPERGQGGEPPRGSFAGWGEEGVSKLHVVGFAGIHTIPLQGRHYYAPKLCPLASFQTRRHTTLKTAILH